MSGGLSRRRRETNGGAQSSGKRRAAGYAFDPVAANQDKVRATHCLGSRFHAFVLRWVSVHSDVVYWMLPGVLNGCPLAC